MPLLGFQDFKQTVLLLHHRPDDPVIMPDTDINMLPSVLVMAHVDPPKIFLPDQVALHNVFRPSDAILLCIGLVSPARTGQVQ